MTPLWLTVLVTVFAAYRFTKFVVDDVIFNTPRDWVLARFPGAGTAFDDLEVAQGVHGVPVAAASGRRLIRVDGQWMAEKPTWLGSLIECPWCASVWVSVGVVAFVLFVPYGVLWLSPFAVSAVVGLVYRLGSS